MLLLASPAAADTWYEHYFRAEKALEDQDWTLAVQEINEALEKKGDSGARVRSYGMKVTPYFPYLKLGIAYFQLDQFDAALQAFETEMRLGAVAQSDTASAELERYRGLAQAALAQAAVEERERIRQIVEQGLADARGLEARGLLDQAVAAIDQALAVAPDDVDARAAMSKLRQLLAEREGVRETDQRVTGLVEEGRALLDQRQYGEASSLFRQALSLKSSAEIQALLNEAQGRLLAELEAGRESDDRRVAIAKGLEQARALESSGRLATALDRLESVLALAPSNRDALSLQGRLLQARKNAESERDRRETISRLLAEAGNRFDAGSAEAALSAANRVLALDPDNGAALEYVAKAYGVISRQLLGSSAGGNIPPAVRFVDFRQEADDGSLVETVSTPEFRLNGVVIDNTPVEVVFYGSGPEPLETALSVQPLGEYSLTEFNVDATLPPGTSTFRLVATDTEGLISSSEYTVVYARPFFRASWFYGLLLAGALLTGAALVWRRAIRREQLRKRRFNPYVAGAPVLEDEMFFGRRDLVDRILQTIHNNSLLLYGERRIGKTSIQHQIKKRLSQLDDPAYEFHPVYIDLQGTPETRFFATLADDIFEELEPVLDGLQPAKDTSRDYDYRDFVRDVRAVLKTLKKRTSKKIKLVLLIDEVDELNDYDPRINQKLRSLFMKSFAENLASVVSGVEIKKHWEREGSPWYNFFEEIRVEPLDPEEARELIERPIRRFFTLDSGTADRIIALTGGKPYLIQKLCIALVTRLHEGHRRKVTIADVDAVGRPKEVC